MARKKLPPAKNWQERNIDDWNAVTFFNYLCDKHRELRGIDYFASRGVKIDNVMLKQMYEKHGKLETKLFIDQCLKEYKGSPQYKVCTFMFMRTYMIAQVMPKVQEGIKRSEEIKTASEANLDDLTF
ncbi:hypothetical protein WBU96_28205 [Bacillus albus]|uniref:hypothetical protein n=1 Tax=Bacillus albus TaxID=2026189 RepID=UPI00301480A3